MDSRPPLSERALAMPESPIRRLAPLAAAARAAGKRVFPLNIGQPDIATPREMLAPLHGYADVNVAYGPSEGLPEFLDALLAYHASVGLAVEREDLFVTTGGSEALLFVFAAIADHGDEVVVFEPFYTNYSGFSDLVGVRCVPVRTHADDGYHLPPAAAIEERIGPRTRAIVLCSPNNPTGTVYGDEELERVADLCRKHRLFLVSDEVYREFTYDGRSHRSALTLEGLEQQVIVTDSLSKRVSLCGARVGWIVSRNRELMRHVLRFGQARLCPPTLGQRVGAALMDVPASYMRDVIAEYQRRRDLVYESLSRIAGVTVRRPEGAFYVCPRVPVDDCQRFAEFMLRDFDLDGDSVMIAPADGFYATPGLGRDELRIAYVLCEEELRRAMEVFAAALAAYPGAG